MDVPVVRPVPVDFLNIKNLYNETVNASGRSLVPATRCACSARQFPREVRRNSGKCPRPRDEPFQRELRLGGGCRLVHNPREQPLLLFPQGNIVNRVFYDKHGDWEYTLLSYPPSVLPKSVEKLIHGSFGGYRISFANEIRRPGQDPYYVVNIENANHIKVIQVEGDQIDIRQSLIKG
jgi:hypothetical protein